MPLAPFRCRCPKHHFRLTVRTEQDAVPRAGRHVLAGHVVVNHHGSIQGRSGLQGEVEPVLGVRCVHGTDPFSGMIACPVFVAGSNQACGHRLRHGHAHHAVRHGKVAGFGHDVAVDEHHAVRVEARDRVGRHVFGPGLGRRSGLHRRREHRRDRTVFPALRLAGRHRKIGQGRATRFRKRRQPGRPGTRQARDKVLRFLGRDVVRSSHQATGSLIQS